MSKGRRWQPRHPDPAKAQRLHDDTSTHSERALDAMRDRPEPPAGERCSFATCFEYTDPYLGLPLCRPHALEVRAALNRQDDEREQRVDAEIAERAANRARSAAKLDAGQRLRRGELAPGWVYYLAVDDLIKVGFSTNVTERLRQYPPSARLLAVEPGTRLIEKERHGQLSAQLAKGREWFHDTAEVRQWIAIVVAEYGSPENHKYLWTVPTRSQQFIRAQRAGRAI